MSEAYENAAIEFEMLRKACTELDEQQEGFCYPSGKFANLEALVGHCTLFNIYLCSLLEKQTVMTRMMISELMEGVSDENLKERLAQVAAIFQILKHLPSDILLALLIYDQRHMETEEDLDLYQPVCMLYLDFLERIGLSVVKAAQGMQAMDILDETEEYISGLQEYALQVLPDLRYTRPFVDIPLAA